jgi:RNA polymerase primary sigma factor
MPKQELLGEVKKLINLGKEKGFLTYDDLNSTLPADVVSSDQFSTIMTMFGEMDIEIVESAETERAPKAAEGEEAIEESEEAEASEENEKEIDLTPGALSRTDDPVRLYLKEMGSVALLSREGEIEIAKRIEEGKKGHRDGRLRPADDPGVRAQSAGSAEERQDRCAGDRAGGRDGGRL